MPPIISCFDPDIASTDAMLGQCDTASDALALLDDSDQNRALGTKARAQIKREMAKCKATAMANLALKRRKETGEDGIAMVFPLLQSMGYDRQVLEYHLPVAQRLYAQSIAASQKVLEHARSF